MLMFQAVLFWIVSWWLAELVDGEPMGTAVAAVCATMALSFAIGSARHAVISIASKGGQTILASTRGQSRSSIIDFLETLEREKLTANAPLPTTANAVPGAIPPKSFRARVSSVCR